MSRRAFSVAIYAVHDSRILLIEHLRLKCWLPVGGETDLLCSRVAREPFEYGTSVRDDVHIELPFEAAQRKLREETKLIGRFAPSSFYGAPLGFIGYEEHDAGSKGLHMNFNFMCHVDSTDVKSDGSFDKWAWLTQLEIAKLDNVPENVRQAATKL